MSVELDSTALTCVYVCALKHKHTGFYVFSSRGGFSGFSHKLETHNIVKFPLSASTFSLSFFHPPSQSSLCLFFFIFFCRLPFLLIFTRKEGGKKRREET